ncbi:MAG TPA: hypothetical protein VJ848_06895 [Candidatus Angelobacter sp.]|nr:hypothetical protein [Candidatus Angelobacter sp.]
MAEHKRNVSKKELSEQEAGQTEASPNPHNETNVVEMPIRTDQRQDTQGEDTQGENVSQSPSTTEGILHPSVGEGVGGGVADTDSMFNEADPQTEEILSSAKKKQRGTKKKNPA